VLFNNIFWQNEAFFWNGAGLVSAGTIDLEVFGTPGALSPNYSMLSVPYPGGANNIVGADPLFIHPVPLDLQATPNRFNLAEISVQILPPEGTLIGFSDYHLMGASPAINAGTPAFAAVSAPADDYDHDARPQGPAFDIGADEVPFVPGDAGGDGFVSMGDALMVAQDVIGLIPTVEWPENADVNGDDMVTMTDAMLIAQYVVGLIPEFP
jgi:hypothetical protein